MREQFEAWILATEKQTQPFGLVERSGDGYLDLYTQKKWYGWQAARNTVPLPPNHALFPFDVYLTVAELIGCTRSQAKAAILRQALQAGRIQ